MKCVHMTEAGELTGIVPRAAWVSNLSPFLSAAQEAVFGCAGVKALSQTSLERGLKKLKAIYDWARRLVGELTNAKPVVVFIPGCWDLFHIGHLNVIKRAAALGDFLVVGVVTSRFMRAYKGNEVIPFDWRRKVVGAVRYVDATVPYEVDDFSVFDKYDVTIWVVGPEHGIHEFQKRVNRELKRRGVKCVVLPRTPNVSTAMIKERIRVMDPEEKTHERERT